MRIPPISSFSPIEIELGTKVFRYLAGNTEYVTPTQMIAFLRLSGLENHQLSVVWEKATGATKKNFHLADTLHLLRMLAMVQQGKELTDELLFDESFPYVSDLSFCLLDDGSDVDIIDDSRSSTPTGNLGMRSSLSGESSIPRDPPPPSPLQNGQALVDLSISRCNILSNPQNGDQLHPDPAQSMVHVGLDSSVSSDPVDVSSSANMADSIVPVSFMASVPVSTTVSGNSGERHSDAKLPTDFREQRDDQSSIAKTVPPLTTSPGPANNASTAPYHPTVLASFVDITRHFQEALTHTQDMVHKVIDVSNPLMSLTLVSPDQISTLKKQLSEMSKKLIDQLNSVSDQSFTSSLSSCLKGLESLSNALTMLISKERQVIKATNEILSYLDGSDDEDGVQPNDLQQGEHSENEDKQEQDSTDTDTNATHAKSKGNRAIQYSNSDNVLLASISVLPANAIGSSAATYQGGEHFPPTHPLPTKKRNLIKLVQNTREVMNSIRTVEASYVRVRETNRIYKSFHESLSSILKTETETNINLEEQQKTLERKVEEKALLIDKQIEKIKSTFSEQTAMFNSMVSVLMSSPAFKNQLNQFTIELADRAVSEVYNALSGMSKLEGISNELKSIVQSKLVQSTAQGGSLSLESHEFRDVNQQRPPQISYNTISHTSTSTRSELVAQQAIRSIVRDELRSLKGELVEEIRNMITNVFISKQNPQDSVHGIVSGSASRFEPNSAPIGIPQAQYPHANAAVTPSISVDERMKPWAFRFG